MWSGKRDPFDVIHDVPTDESPFFRANEVRVRQPHRAIPLLWAAINAGDHVDKALKDMVKIMTEYNRDDEAIEAIKSFRRFCPLGSRDSIDKELSELIEWDPTAGIPLFWGRLNAGDQVETALKNMVEVMNELNRPEEAIEAIKSFRHLCPLDSRESIDYILIELYKKLGMTDKEIEMLECKLSNIRLTQGVEQEKASILGKLASAYMKSHNYGTAEKYFRKALAIQPDSDWHCNLAICLIHMNKISEAQALSTSWEPRDESHINSFREALRALHSGFESILALYPIDVTESTQGSFPTSSTIELQTELQTVPRRWSDLVELEEANNPLVRGLPEAGAEHSTEEDK